MSWHLKYWDTVDQLYWDPSLLGLASIPKGEWEHSDTGISIPSERVKNGGSIYTRKGTAQENAQRMRRLEEPLNHIFDITFGIAPDEAIRRMFLRPLGFNDDGSFERFGREVASRYPGFANSNTTQQDAFFVGSRSLVGVELKLGSKTWPGQVLKYLALMVAEEKLTGKREQIGLLYITPHDSSEQTFAQIGADVSGALASDFIDEVPPRQINKMLAGMLVDDREQFMAAAGRLRLGHTSWCSLEKEARRIVLEENADDCGGETLRRLMEGFANAITSHEGCVPSSIPSPRT